MKVSGVMRNTTALFVIQVANQLLPLVLVPYLTRALGLEAYGVYAFSLSMAAFSCVLTDFGFNLWATAEVSKNQEDKELVNRVYGRVMLSKVFLLMICIFGVFACVEFSGFQREYERALRWTIFAIFGMTFQPVWLFNGLERMAYIAICVLIARLVFVIMAVAMINSVSDLGLLIILNGVSQIIAAILGWVFLWRLGYSPMKCGLMECWRVMQSASAFFLSRVAVSSYATVGALFLGIFSSPRNVAIYSVAEQLYRGAQSLLSPLGQVMYPYMVRSGNFQALWRMVIGVVAISITGAVFTIVMRNEIVILFFGSQYLPATSVLCVFMITIIVNSPSILLGYPALGALGRLNLANRSVIVAGVFQIVVLAILATTGHATPIGVAVGILLAEVVVLTLRAKWTYQHHQLYATKIEAAL